MAAAIVIGACVFFLFGGRYVLSPALTDWLMYHDPSAHYLGWAFFRQTPLAQWPLGANPDFGEATGSSIVFSDSIPLLALPLKALHAVLPTPFQYFGAWLLACLCAQAYAATRLLRRLFDEAPGTLGATVWLGAALLTLCPVLLWRLHGHAALLAHWVLLCAVGLALSRTYRGAFWTVLLGATVLIHAYLFVMVGAVWVADLARRCLVPERGPETLWRRAAALFSHAAITIAICGGLAWAAGYFLAPPAIGLSARDAGFGLYRADLTAFIDPDIVWSRFLTDIPDGVGGDAGFAYLGLGGLFLLSVVAMLTVLGRARWPRIRLHHAPLLAVGIAFLFYAVSSTIALGEHVLADVRLPAILDPLLVSFRASGRFIWLPAYLLLIGTMVVAVRTLGKRSFVSVLMLALGLQLADLSTAMSFFHDKFSAPYAERIRSPLWDRLAERHDRLALVPATPFQDIYLPLARFAARNGLSINTAYLARTDPVAERLTQDEVLSQVAEGRLREDTLYVFADEAQWLAARAAAPAEALSCQLDGFPILAMDAPMDAPGKDGSRIGRCD